MRLVVVAALVRWPRVSGRCSTLWTRRIFCSVYLRHDIVLSLVCRRRRRLGETSASLLFQSTPKESHCCRPRDTFHKSRIFQPHFGLRTHGRKQRVCSESFTLKVFVEHLSAVSEGELAKEQERNTGKVLFLSNQTQTSMEEKTSENGVQRQERVGGRQRGSEHTFFLEMQLTTFVWH